MILRQHAIMNVFTFEVVFAIFLFAGTLKASPRLNWIPVDLTGLALSLSFLIGLKIFFAGNRKIPSRVAIAFLFLLGFETWAVLSLMWSPSVTYARHKALLMVALGMWAFIGASVIVGSSRVRVKRLLGAFVVLSVWVAIDVSSHFINLGNFSNIDLISNYLGLGRLVGVSVLILTAYSLWICRQWQMQTLVVFVFVLLVTVMLLGGGRGPMVAVAVALLVPLFRDTNWVHGRCLVRTRLLVFVGGMVSIPIIVMLLAKSEVYLRTVIRFWVFFTEGGGASAQARVWFFKKAIEHWQTAPLFGNGLGSWPVLMGSNDLRAYPHNIVLEVLVELGVVGLALLGLLTVSIFYRFNLARLRNDSLATMVYMLVVYTITNAMFSGDLTDNRIVFAMLGTLAGLNWRTRQQT